MFDLQPCLDGEHVRLRPLVESDWTELFAVAADPLIWAQHPASDRYQEPVFRRFFQDALASGGALAARDTSDRMIGSSRFNFDPAEPESIEIGWTFLARECWGGGVNREIKRLMLAHAFQFVDKVIFRVGEGNLRSRKAMENIGAHLTTERRELTLLPNGAPIVHVVYEMTRDRFAARF